MQPNPARRISVLIDADNAWAKIAGGLFENIVKIGHTRARPAYGVSGR